MTSSAQFEALTCADCRFWRGRCTKGEKMRLSLDSVCEKFKPKIDRFQRLRLPHSVFGWCPKCKTQITEKDVERLFSVFGKVEAGTLCYQCTIREANKEVLGAPEL